MSCGFLSVLGRDPETGQLNLDKAGVDIHTQTKKILGNNNEQTTVPHIFAIGDVLQDRPELTPVAIRAGKLLADRLFGGSEIIMDYDKVSYIFSFVFWFVYCCLMSIWLLNTTKSNIDG